MAPPKIGRLHGFLVVSAVLITVVVAVAGLVVGWFFKDHVLAHEASRSAEAILSEARQELTPYAFDAPLDEGSVARFQRLFEGLSSFFRIKAFDLTGRIVWSNEQRLIGATFPDDLDFSRARHGEIVTRIGMPTKTEHRYERGVPWIAEVYVPIAFHDSARVAGVIETYRDVTPIVEGIRRTQRLIWGVAGAAGLLLWTALALVASKASVNERRAIRQLATQNRELMLLQRVTRSLLRPLDPGQVAQSVVANTVTGLGLSRAAIYRVDTATDPILLAAWPPGASPVPATGATPAATVQEEPAQSTRVAFPLLTHRGTTHLFTGDLAKGLALDEVALRSLEIMLDEAAVALDNAELFADIREAHERLSAILSGVADRMLIVDRDMRIVWMNAAASEASEDVLGRHCFSALGMESGDCGDCPAMRTFKSGMVERGVRMARSPDGEARYMDLVTAPLRDGSGRIYQVLEVARDITDLMRMEERLKETNQALLDAQTRLVENERLAAIGQVVVTLHHAILNPLTGILGALGILKSGGISEEIRRQALTAAETEVRRIERLVRDLPELRRAEGIPYVGQTTMLDIEEPGP